MSSKSLALSNQPIAAAAEAAKEIRIKKTIQAVVRNRISHLDRERQAAQRMMIEAPQASGEMKKRLDDLLEGLSEEEADRVTRRLAAEAACLKAFVQVQGTVIMELLLDSEASCKKEAEISKLKTQIIQLEKERDTLNALLAKVGGAEKLEKSSVILKETVASLKKQIEKLKRRIIELEAELSKIKKMPSKSCLKVEPPLEDSFDQLINAFSPQKEIARLKVRLAQLREENRILREKLADSRSRPNSAVTKKAIQGLQTQLDKKMEALAKKMEKYPKKEDQYLDEKMEKASIFAGLVKTARDLCRPNPRLLEWIKKKAKAHGITSNFGLD